jgi:selenide,water dikinase
MVQKNTEIQVSLSSIEEEVLYDPQTSGGLLFSVPDAQAEALLKALHAAGIQSAVRVGEIIDGPAGITVV